MFKHLMNTVVLRLLDWLTRRRSVGTGFLRSGVVLVIGTLGIDYTAQIARNTKEGSWSFSFGIGQGIPFWVTLLCALVGLSLIAIGAAILFAEYRRESRSKLVVIEMRGLHSSPDTLAVDQVLPEFRGVRTALLLDFRPQGEASRVDPSFVIERMSSMKGTLQSLVDGHDKRDVQVAVGGLAAVPALFLAGLLLDDESHIHLYDWDRDAKEWLALAGADDSFRFLPLEGPSPSVKTLEVVLVMEVSYPVRREDIAATFGETAVVARLSVEKPIVNRFFSEIKQREMAVQFRDAVQQLQAAGVLKIHLVAAAPASFAIRLGMTYDKRLLPLIVVYQFEHNQPNPYPWGLEMPTDGADLNVVRTIREAATN